MARRRKALDTQEVIHFTCSVCGKLMNPTRRGSTCEACWRLEREDAWPLAATDGYGAQRLDGTEVGAFRPVRVLRDALSGGECLVALGQAMPFRHSGAVTPFVARITGPDATFRYAREFLGTRVTTVELGVKVADYAVGTLVPVTDLLPVDLLDIRAGSTGTGLLRAFYLWQPATGLEVITERELKAALGSFWRSRMLARPWGVERAIRLRR
jgi:hypothetical protein